MDTLTAKALRSVQRGNVLLLTGGQGVACVAGLDCRLGLQASARGVSLLLR
jgi:hypothetical protein